MADPATPETALAAILDMAVEAAAADGADERGLEERAGLPAGTLERARATGQLDFRVLFRLCEAADLDICAVEKEDYGRRLDAGLF